MEIEENKNFENALPEETNDKQVRTYIDLKLNL